MKLNNKTGFEWDEIYISGPYYAVHTFAKNSSGDRVSAIVSMDGTTNRSRVEIKSKGLCVFEKFLNNFDAAKESAEEYLKANSLQGE